MQKSTTPIAVWFAATECCILKATPPFNLLRVTVCELADFLGVSFKTAWRVRERSFLDVLPGGAGLLRRCVCTVNFQMPPDVERWTRLHLEWVLDSLYPEALTISATSHRYR